VQLRISAALCVALACDAASPRTVADEPAVAPESTAAGSDTKPAAAAASPLPTMHVVAVRGGPLALEVSNDVELVRAGIEPIQLSGDGELRREPRHLAGMRDLLEGLDEPRIDVASFGGRWPHGAVLVAAVSSEYAEGSFGRSVRWDGGRWRRDDPVKRGIKRMFVAAGPFEHGTMLGMRRPEHVAPGRRGWIEALEDAQPTTFVQRAMDGTERDGPPLPASGVAAVASTASGLVLAGDRRLSVWKPGASAWQELDPPGGESVWITGFVVHADDDAHALGVTHGSAGDAGWIAHWDGRAWASVPAPPCQEQVVALARHEERTWVLCAEIHAEVRPGDRSLWRQDGANGWQEVRFALDDRGAPQPTAATSDAARPLATDLAVTRDGTLWIVCSEVAGALADPGTKTWWLLRTGAAARVLELPTDPELFDALP
jgi:hypothetical protein